MVIFFKILFFLSSITGGLLMLAILLDLLLFGGNLFSFSDYLQSFALIASAIFIWYVIIPYYEWKRR